MLWESGLGNARHISPGRVEHCKSFNLLALSVQPPVACCLSGHHPSGLVRAGGCNCTQSRKFEEMCCDYSLTASESYTPLPYPCIPTASVGRIACRGRERLRAAATAHPGSRVANLRKISLSQDPFLEYSGECGALIITLICTTLQRTVHEESSLASLARANRRLARIQTPAHVFRMWLGPASGHMTMTTVIATVMVHIRIKDDNDRN